MNKILVAGASGIAGTAAVRYFAVRPGWEVIGVSRRVPLQAESVPHIAVDLTDAQGAASALREVTGVTHVAYMALQEQSSLRAGWHTQSHMDVNLAMLRNLMDGLQHSGNALRHVTLLEGNKAYGSHLKQVRVPAKERWPRGDHSIFYWLQEDFLRERQRSEGWDLSILRSQRILGLSIGSPMSIIAAIGVYASVMRELGEPLRFPGGRRHVTACTDSRLIAQAIEFAGTSPQAAGETFNVVNGDVVVWADLWPSLAKHFDMPVGDARPMKLAEEMPKLAAVWDKVVTRHQLQALSMEALVGAAWQFADYGFALGQEPPRSIMSPIKIRQAGFAACYDTEDSVIYWLTQLQQANLLPR